VSGCCSGQKRVLVELEYLVVGGETCDRCGGTREETRAAVLDAAGLLSGVGIAVDLVEREIPPSKIAQSNRVLVNGIPAETWVGGHAVMTGCSTCEDLVGGGPACCRAIEVNGVQTEVITREVVVDAIMAAAGLAPGHVTKVTLVTAGDCG